jgi:predicted metal-dependent hydrolase
MMASTPLSSLSPTLLAAVRQFNEGAFFRCHETLEVLWQDEPGPIRAVYQGVLQIGIGLLHWQRGNHRGTRILLLRGNELLRPFLPAALGLDLTGLSAAVADLIELLDTPGGPPPLTDDRRPCLHPAVVTPGAE